MDPEVPADEVVAVALALVDRQRWVGYELVYHHPGGLAALTVENVVALGRGLDNWGGVDAFGCYVSGPAWRLGRIDDAVVREWAAADGDDMVVKALSWALRELVIWDAAAVRAFVTAHEDVLAARVRREVASKPATA